MSAEAATGWVRRARDGASPMALRHAAFDELVQMFEGMAFKSALRLLDDSESARDATQEAFLAAWLKLERLRDPEAFGGWLKRLVSTECSRQRRKTRSNSDLPETGPSSTTERELRRHELQRLLAREFARFPESERRTLVLHHLLGHRIAEIAVREGIPRATVGKRLYSARLRIRRNLPRSIREDSVGEYRFEERPDLVVKIEREHGSGVLVSYGRGRPNVLVPLDDATVVTTAFDGTDRFERDEDGRVTQFVYYEFGARLGVAKKLTSVG